MSFFAFDRLIFDHAQVYSLIVLCFQNLPQNIFNSSPTPAIWLNRLRNFMKICVTTPKPQNKKIHASSTLLFLSMLQYSHSYEFLFTFFVSDKIGSKVLLGPFSELDYHFQNLRYDVFFGGIWWGIPCKSIHSFICSFIYLFLCSFTTYKMIYITD